MVSFLSRIALVMAILLGSMTVYAEEAESKPVLEVPKATEAPVIDGALNDPIWKSAAVIDGLKPARGAKTEDSISGIPTTIRVLWDKDYLYVSFQCTDNDIYVSGTMKRDENLYTEDVCEVFIDGKGDGRQYIETQVSPLNQTLDLMMLSTDEVDLNDAGMLKGPMIKRDWWSLREWDCKELRHAAGRIIENGKVTGWTVEMAIPAGPVVRRLGLKQYKPMDLRANFLRYDWQPKEVAEDEEKKRDLLHMNWSPVNGGCPHISPGGMGTLRLMPEPEGAERE